MLVSKLIGERYKEKPADAYAASHIFMLRGAYIRQVSNGIFTLLPPALKIVQKIEQILREEMNKVDGQEVLFPVVLPATLWQESGRFETVGSALLRFKDRADRDMLLAMTHEEACVHLARSEAKTYDKYPFMVYQIQTKYRDEPRARGGLLRVREFTMKDAYSFHRTREDSEKYYDKVLDSYVRIFERAGLGNVVVVESDSGMMGGKVAHEFMYLSPVGEDAIVQCDSCDYKANQEVAGFRKNIVGKEIDGEIEAVHTPNIKEIDALADFLSVEKNQIIKSVLYADENEKRYAVFIRGDLDANEAKLQNHLQVEELSMIDTEIHASLPFGFVGPYNMPEVDGLTLLFDDSLDMDGDFVTGGNKVDYHYKGVSVRSDLKPEIFVDVANVQDGARCVHCDGTLSIQRGVEVGNIFQLGTQYTESMCMTYIDEQGKGQTPIMNCYGIGVGRLFACILEEYHDDYGPIWPAHLAPWPIQICALNYKNDDVQNKAVEIYDDLCKDHEVLFDNRDVSAGIQFADADLLGAPVRIIVSGRNVKEDMVEISTRDKTFKEMVPYADIRKTVDELLSK